MPRDEYDGRYTTAYFATREEKDFWEKFAEVHGTTLSKLLLVGLEALRGREQSKPHPDLLQENVALKEALERSRRELAQQSILMERYESELYKARHAAFQEVDPLSEDGSRRYDLELINLLQSSGRGLDSRGILSALRIDPQDLEATKLVRNQLESMTRYGLARETSSGWKWVR